mgnify:FL=1
MAIELVQTEPYAPIHVRAATTQPPIDTELDDLTAGGATLPA